MSLQNCQPNPSRPCLEVPGDTSELSGIRHHSTHVLDQWTVEIFEEPAQRHFLARVVGMPGLLGRGPTEAASVHQLRRLLGEAV